MLYRFLLIILCNLNPAPKSVVYCRLSKCSANEMELHSGFKCPLDHYGLRLNRCLLWNFVPSSWNVRSPRNRGRPKLNYIDLSIKINKIIPGSELEYLNHGFPHHLVVTLLPGYVVNRYK